MTDVAGFLCLIPWTRRALIAAALRRMQVRYTSGGPGGPHGPTGSGDTRGSIEGEFHRRD